MLFPAKTLQPKLFPSELTAKEIYLWTTLYDMFLSFPYDMPVPLGPLDYDIPPGVLP